MIRSIFKITRRVTVKLVLFVIICMLPLNLYSIFATQRAQDIMFNQTALSINSIMNQSISFLDSQMVDADIFLFQLLTGDAKGITFSNQRNDLDYLNARHYLSRKLNGNLLYQTAPDIYFFYAPEISDLLLCKKNSLAMSRSEFYGLLKNEQLLEKYKDWRPLYVDEQLFLMRSSRISGIYFGSLIDLEKILAEMKKNISYSTCEITTKVERENIDSEEYLLTETKSSVASLYFYARIKRSEIINELPLLERTQILLAFLSLLLIPIFILLLNRMILRPLRKINYALNRLKNGDREYRIGSHHQYSEEFLNINKSFNEMADRIEQLKMQKYEYELEWQRVEIKNLQLQIRPHFLLNMFNLIYSLFQLDEKKELEQVILYLSDYFRYLFRGNTELEPFGMELDLIKKYMHVAEIRYPGMINFCYTVEEDMEKILVPPLLIHNFIENAVRHTLVPGSVRRIELRAQMRADKAIFIVEDDGMGIPENIIKEINEKRFTRTATHVGIQNSYQRLLYLFGEEAELYIYRLNPHGSGIKISVGKPVSACI